MVFPITDFSPGWMQSEKIKGFKRAWKMLRDLSLSLHLTMPPNTINREHAVLVFFWSQLVTTRGTSLQTRLKLQRWRSRKTEKIWILDDILRQNHSSKEYTLPLKVFLCEVINCCIFSAIVRLSFWYLRPKESKLFCYNHSRGLYIWTGKSDWTIEEWHIFINEYRWMAAIYMTLKNDIFVAYIWEEK